MGLGLWQGSYKQVERAWLRWYGESGNWLPTPAETAALVEQERLREQQRADAAEAELAQLKSLLQAKGIDPTAL